MESKAREYERIRRLCNGCKRVHRKGENCNLSLVKCYKCQRKGHYARDCESRESENEMKDVQIQRVDSGRKYIPVNVNGQRVVFLADTGADVTCISERKAKELGFSNILEKDLRSFSTFGGTSCVSKGSFWTNLSWGGRTLQTKIWVVKEASEVLGHSELEKLGVVSWNEGEKISNKKIADNYLRPKVLFNFNNLQIKRSPEGDLSCDNKNFVKIFEKNKKKLQICNDARG